MTFTILKRSISVANLLSELLSFIVSEQVDEAGWREFKKLQEQMEQDKRDMKALTIAFIQHRAQTAADTLVHIQIKARVCPRWPSRHLKGH